MASFVQPIRALPKIMRNTAVNYIYFTMQELRLQYPRIQKHISEIHVQHMRGYVSPFTSTDIIAKLKVIGRKSVTYLNNIYFRRTFAAGKAIFFGEDQQIDVARLREPRQIGPIVTSPLTRVNFIMALSGRPGNLVRFLQNYKDCFLQQSENISLTIVYFPDEKTTVNSETTEGDDTMKFVEQNLEQVRKEYPEADLKLVPVRNGLAFSRGIGMQIGVKNRENEGEEDKLLFFCDVDLVFQPEILLHIRRNTIRGKQVFYPTFFSQYDPQRVYEYYESPKTHFYFEEIAGFWRTFSYGMVSLYTSDFMRTNGFDMSIKGWGLEDLRFVSISYVVIFNSTGVEKRADCDIIKLSYKKVKVTNANECNAFYTNQASHNVVWLA